MAITEVYVDPSINADSGTGASGTPYGDLEYALEQTTFDTTNGTRFNIKAGSTETLAANLYTASQDTVTTIAYVPSETARLVFQGYTTTAGDGGIGDISGGGSVPVWSDNALDYITFVDCKCHNTGANRILNMDAKCAVIRCEVTNSTSSNAAVDLGSNGLIIGCYIHNCSGPGIVTNQGLATQNAIITGPTNNFTAGITMNGTTTVLRNIISVQGSANGINHNVDAGIILNNSIYSNGGTGSGISCAVGDAPVTILNNLIEGFSDTGGFGIEYVSNNQVIPLVAGNAVRNDCDTVYGTAGLIVDNWSKGGADTNETLTASPFNDASTDDFAPVDTGSVKEGSYPPDFGDGGI